MQQRYDLREEPSGLWSVIDIFTGLPADLKYRPAANLGLPEADDLAYLLNLLDQRRRKYLGIM